MSEQLLMVNTVKAFSDSQNKREVTQSPKNMIKLI